MLVNKILKFKNTIMTKYINLSEFKLTEISYEEKVSVYAGADGVGKKIGQKIGWFIGQVVNGVVWIHETFKQPTELIGVK